MRLAPDIIGVGIAHILRRILLDQRGAAAEAGIHHRRFLPVQVGEGVEITVAFPARRHEFGQALPVIQRLQHLLGFEQRTVLVVEQLAAIGRHHLADQNIDEQIVARHGQAVDLGLAVLVLVDGQLFRDLDEIVRFRRPMPSFFAGPCDRSSARCRTRARGRTICRRQNRVLVMLPDIVFADRLDDIVDRQQQLLLQQRRAVTGWPWDTRLPAASAI